MAKIMSKIKRNVLKLLKLLKYNELMFLYILFD